MRLLYACAHPTLRKSDIEVLLSSGFEVIPSFVHIQFRGKYRVDPKESDDPTSVVNRMWKKSVSISDLDTLRIQMIDFYRVSEEPFSMPIDGSSRVEDKSFNIAGFVTDEEAELINRHIDVIVVQSFPNVVPNIFSWFKGIVVFRIFGNEDPDFSVWSWYKKKFYSSSSNEFFFNRGRFISLSVFKGIVETERAEILGPNRCILNSVVFEKIQEQVSDLTWRGELSLPKVVTNISYLDVSKSWRKYYENFKKEFSSIDFDVFGKNDITNSYCKGDIRIKGQISDYREYLQNYCNYRVFCNVGKLKQHSQYTPFEAAAMGIPVLFLSDSAIGYEAKLFYSDIELGHLGMTADLTEMSKVAQRCVDDAEYAVDLSSRQQAMFRKVFGLSVAKTQGLSFYETCMRLTSGDANRSDLKSVLNTPSKGREKRILWAFYHKTNRYEELPLWIAAGFEVVPIAMPEHLGAYQGASYDDESDPMYPDWRSSCTLDAALVDLVRSIQFITDDYMKDGLLSEQEIKILNNHFAFIYIPSSPTMALNLLKKGYSGVILNRYFGHYSTSERSLTRRLEKMPYRSLKYFSNYIWLPAMRSLSVAESSAIAPPERTCLVSYLYRTPESLGECTWSGANSRAEVSAVISLAHSELHHYYRNFVKYFGQFNYKIFGKNRFPDLANSSINDPGIVGLLDKETDLYQRICESRVFVETGMVPYHSYYTPIEAFALQIPVLFHSESGVAAELLAVFNKEQLLSMGMCNSWEEMAIKVERCLLDVSYAIDISTRQRVLVGFISKSQVINEMRHVFEVSERIRLSRNVFGMPPLSSIRKMLVSFEFTTARVFYSFRRMRLRFLEFRINLKKTVALIKKVIYLIRVFLGLKKENDGLKEKMWAVLKKFQ